MWKLLILLAFLPAQNLAGIIAYTCGPFLLFYISLLIDWFCLSQGKCALHISLNAVTVSASRSAGPVTERTTAATDPMRKSTAEVHIKSCWNLFVPPSLKIKAPRGSMVRSWRGYSTDQWQAGIFFCIVESDWIFHMVLFHLYYTQRKCNHAAL